MISIYYGTESGNSEMVAEEVSEALNAAGFGATVTELSEVEPSELTEVQFALIITSTYGEGELPESSEAFHDTLVAEQPNLSGVRFAAFGLGDSSYETYNNGVDILSSALTAAGAEQVGQTGRHDASSGASPIAVAIRWALELTESLQPLQNA